jgi:hypothetical protein
MNSTLLLKLAIAIVAGLFLLAAFTLVSDPDGRAALTGLAGVLIGWVVNPPGSGGGKVPFLPLLFAAALTGAQGCRSEGVEWPRLARCAPAPSELVDRVAEVLQADGAGTLSDRAVSALEQLAREHGPSLVACAVTELVDEWSSQARSADNDVGRRAAIRGAAFLQRVGTQTRQEPQ